jgi:long-chain fatty acid transport protein
MSFGAGFQVNVQGVRQIAMGGTGTSWPRDASTIFYNPAGLSRLTGMQAYGSINFLMINTKYVSSPVESFEAESKPAVYTPFNLYIGGPIKKDSKFGVGLGIYTPFGSGMTWDDDWVGRYVIQSIAMQAIFIQPTVSYQINDLVSVGAGFIYAFGKIAVKRAVPLQDQNNEGGHAEIDGKSSGVGFNLGVHFKPSEKLQFGINYRSAVEMDVKGGQAKFLVPSSLASSFPTSEVTSTLPLPQVLSFGVGFKPFDDITIQAEANFTGWKTFDTLRFDFEENTPLLQDSKSPRNYNNTWAIRLGGLWQASDRLQVMLGGAFDPTPVANGFVSPDLPDGDRWLVSGGLTYKATDKLTILAALELGTSVKRESEFTPDNFNGKYQTKAVIPSIGVSYDF